MLKRAILWLSLIGLIGVLAACGSTGEKGAKEKDAKSAEMPAQPKPGDMVLVKAGKFKMGSNEEIEGAPTPAYPERELELPAFYIDKYEVTNTEFLTFTAKTGYVSEAESENKGWRTYFSPQRANYPVMNLTWEDAVAYAKSVGKRLPTEEEWEKAARGTDGRRYPWGNEWVGGKANTGETGLRDAAEVGSYAGDESPYGVNDMCGNVQEWTSSWYQAYPGNKKKEPQYGEQFRVARGGSHSYVGKKYALWNRPAFHPKGMYGIGLRCVKDAPTATMQTDPNDRLKELDGNVHKYFHQIAVMVHHSFGGHVALSTKHFK